MEIILRREDTIRKVKTGNANYLYWMLFIPVVTLVMAIFRRQFKMATLNTWLLQIIFVTPLAIVLRFLGIQDVFVVRLIIGVYLMIITVYWIVVMVTRINYLTIQQYLDAGYHVVNEPSAELNIELAKVETAVTPKWIIIK